MIEARLKGDDGAKELLEKAKQRLGDNPLRNALASFYLRPSGTGEGAVEFVHKSFGEFLCAERLKESLEEWTAEGRKRQKFFVDDEQLVEKIYDLLGYGGLTPEIVDYLMALLAVSEEFRPVQLFQRLKDFYFRWCDGEFIDLPEKALPLEKTRQFKELGIQLGQRQVDIYTGLNVMILLLELHRYALSRDDLKDQIVFYPCGQYDIEGFDNTRLLRIIGYCNCISIYSFLKIAGRFLRDVNFSGANLRGANLSGANLRGANLSGAYLTAVPAAMMYT
ncbi:MAG: pentapeptide repeat-containing protein [Symploca sp. SIO2E6]|nr:pentapeptide repeat-containing protein [Symploca sp. SIO2E6]